MRSLDELKEAVEDPVISIDARFFREVVGVMLNRLGFYRQRDEFISCLDDTDYVSSNTLGCAIKSEEFVGRNLFRPVVERIFHQTYSRDCAYFCVRTHHKSWTNFIGNIMHASGLSATCLLETGKVERAVEEFFTEETKDVFLAFEEAYDAGVIPVSINPGREEKLFFYTPKILYAIIAQKDS